MWHSQVILFSWIVWKVLIISLFFVSTQLAQNKQIILLNRKTLAKNHIIHSSQYSYKASALLSGVAGSATILISYHQKTKSITTVCSYTRVPLEKEYFKSVIIWWLKYLFPGTVSINTNYPSGTVPVNKDYPTGTGNVKKMPQSGVGSMQGSSKGCLPLQVVFHHRSSST